VPELHRRAGEEFGTRVQAVGDEQWSLPTPCTEWDVRTLVNHVTGEALWTPPMLQGKTIAEVGDRFEGDVLGDDPKAAWANAFRQASEAVQADGAMEVTAHLSYGDFTGSDYTMQLFADLLIHAWDLARAVGADERLDPELVAACTDWFRIAEEEYRKAGAVGPRPPIPEDADEQTRLLAMFGRAA
jgi:uncharacterized protein (TIGR03086 family)